MKAAVEAVLAAVLREDGAVGIVLGSEELSLVVELEMRAGKAAELLCAGLRVATDVKIVSAGKVVVVILSSGTPDVSFLPGAGVRVRGPAWLLGV